MLYKLLIFISAVLLFSSFISDDEKGNQRAFYECTEPLDADSALFEIRKGKTYFYFETKESPKDLKSKGFIWLEDNPKNYFTAYFINMSDSTFNAGKQDGSLLMIQEAMDEDGEWKPIEYWVYSGCGNSYYGSLSLKTGMYVMIPVKKYSGSFKTKLRLKMKKNKSIFYSDSFEGSIDKKMFEKETGTVNGILYHGPASYFD